MRKATQEAIALLKQTTADLNAAQIAIQPLKKSVVDALLNMLGTSMQDAIDSLRENSVQFSGVYVDYESGVGDVSDGTISGTWGIVIGDKLYSFEDGSYIVMTIVPHVSIASWDQRKFDIDRGSDNDYYFEGQTLIQMPKKMQETLETLSAAGWFSNESADWHELLGIYGHDGFTSTAGELFLKPAELQHLLKKKGFAITL